MTKHSLTVWLPRCDPTPAGHYDCEAPRRPDEVVSRLSVTRQCPCRQRTAARMQHGSGKVSEDNPHLPNPILPPAGPWRLQRGWRLGIAAATGRL